MDAKNCINFDKIRSKYLKHTSVEVSFTPDVDCKTNKQDMSRSH